MRFLADMGVSGRVVAWLSAEGHDAVHLRDLGLQRMPDGEIFALAVREGRILLTFDLDFGEILAHSRGRPPGVLLFRLRNPATAFVVQRLEAVLRTAAAALEQGAIVVVQDAGHRVRERWSAGP